MRTDRVQASGGPCPAFGLFQALRNHLELFQQGSIQRQFVHKTTLFVTEQVTSASRTVLAAVGPRGLNKQALNALAQSGSDIRIYTPLAPEQAARKVESVSAVRLASDQVRQSTGEANLDTAIQASRERLMSDAEQAVNLAIPRAQQGQVYLSELTLLAEAVKSGQPLADVRAEIARQVDSGALIKLDSVAGAGNRVLVPRVAYEMEKTIIRHIAEGSGCNMAGKTLRQHSLNRLWLMALLAQPGYWLAFRDAGLMWWQLNILFAFAVVMQVARFLQAATVLNGVAAFTALVGYLPLSSASYGIPGLLMLAGALLIWQVRDSLRPALFAVWLLLVALLNARHGDVMMLSGVILTLAVLFCVHELVPASGRRLQAGRWFAPAYALHLLCIGFLVSIL